MTQDSPVAFFSYAREDSDFALRLATDLKATGANVWLDQLDIVPGQRWDVAIQDALARCSRMLVILSNASVSSTNVMDEVSFALEQNKAVIPIIQSDCEVPYRLRRLQYVDFREDYARGVAELLETLRSEHAEDGRRAQHAAGEEGRRADEELEQAAGAPVEQGQSEVKREHTAVLSSRRVVWLGVACGTMILAMLPVLFWGRADERLVCVSRDPDGKRGDDWQSDDEQTVNKGPVSRIKIWHGEYIHSVQLFYVDRAKTEHAGKRFGGERGKPASWTVPTGQSIAKVVLRYGAAIDSLEFVRNTGEVSPRYGGGGGTRQEVPIEAGWELKAVKVRTTTIRDSTVVGGLCFVLRRR